MSGSDLRSDLLRLQAAVQCRAWRLPAVSPLDPGWVFSVSFCFWHNMTLYQSRIIYRIQGRYYLMQRRYSKIFKSQVNLELGTWNSEIFRDYNHGFMIFHDGSLWFSDSQSALWILWIRTVGSCSCPRKRLRSAPVASARAWNERGQGQGHVGSKSMQKCQKLWRERRESESSQKKKHNLHNAITMRESGPSLNPVERSIASTSQCSFRDLMVFLRNWLYVSCPGLFVTSGKDHNVWKKCEHIWKWYWGLMRTREDSTQCGERAWTLTDCWEPSFEISVTSQLATSINVENSKERQHSCSTSLCRCGSAVVTCIRVLSHSS